MSYLVYVCLWTFLCLCVATPTPTPPMPPLPPSGCDYNGQHHEVGDNFSPSVCEHCQCAPGNQTYCVHAECLFTPCVDYVQEPGKCCPTCPNGQNCKTPDGFILKKNETYSPDGGLTRCNCLSTYGPAGNVAMCIRLP